MNQPVSQQMERSGMATARRACSVFLMRGLPEPLARQLQQLFAEEVMPRLRNLPSEIGELSASGSSPE